MWSWMRSVRRWITVKNRKKLWKKRRATYGICLDAWTLYNFSQMTFTYAPLVWSPGSSRSPKSCSKQHDTLWIYKTYTFRFCIKSVAAIHTLGIHGKRSRHSQHSPAALSISLVTRFTCSGKKMFRAHVVKDFFLCFIKWQQMELY